MWYIGFPGNEKATEVVGSTIDRATQVVSTVGEVASFVAKTTLKINAPFNPFAKRLLEAYFEKPSPDPTDSLAERQYPPNPSDDSR